MRAIRLSLLLFCVAASGPIFSSEAVFAQSAGLDEAVQPTGSVARNLSLTNAQKSAILNTIFLEPVKSYTTQIAATVGAPVPQTIDLIDLPNNLINVMAGGQTPAGLKYAMAGNGTIVIVDPLQMRVVDVIHNNAKP